VSTEVDIARANGNALAAVNQAGDNLARLGQWVEAARNAHALVAPLVDTAFVPDAYKPKVDPRADQATRQAAREVAVANATAAVLQGISLGIDPLTALQQIYIVHGRPGMYAKMMVALVQAHGHEIGTDDLTDTRAVVWGRRAGTEHVERVTVTMDQARKAGWTANQAYTKTPQDMLWARAAARVCDRIAADVLKGIASVEQIRDEIRVDAQVGPGTRTVNPPRRRAEPAPAITAAEEPPLEDPAPTTPEPEPVDIGDAPEAATAAQTRKLYALLRDTDRGDKDEALRYLTLLLGRDVDSTKTLSKDEARTAIDDLERQAASQVEEPTLDGDGDWPETAKPADAS
jgi:hypothetical protein